MKMSGFKNEGDMTFPLRAPTRVTQEGRGLRVALETCPVQYIMSVSSDHIPPVIYHRPLANKDRFPPTETHRCLSLFL